MTFKELTDVDLTGGSKVIRYNNVRNNQLFIANVNKERPQTFGFKYISDILQGGTGVTISTDKDGITTISNTGVRKIIAGTNITISPITGIGDVTINSTGAASSVTSVTGTAPISSSGGTTPAISISQATTSTNGYLSSADWNTFNNKGNGTVTSVAALTLGTTGTDLTSTVANSTSTPVITLNVPTASATNRGALSSTDWSTFNGKFTLPSLTSGSVLFSNGTTIAQDNTNFFWDNTNKRLGVGTSSPNSKINALDGTVSEFKFNSGFGNNTPTLAVGNTSASGKFAALLAGTAGSVFVYDAAGYFDIGTEAKSYYTSNSLGNPSTRLRVTSAGNVLIGTTTDAGYKLDVNGTARFTGQVTFPNSSSINASGNLAIGDYSIHGSFGYATFSNNVTLLLTGQAFTSTSGIQTGLSFTGSFAPTSGTAIYSAYSILPIINQTGGANGITRGLYINPTLTAAADWRAIEVASGITILGASTTAKASLRIPSGTAPTTPTNGDIWFDGTNLKMQVGGVTKTFTLV